MTITWSLLFQVEIYNFSMATFDYALERTPGPSRRSIIHRKNLQLDSELSNVPEIIGFKDISPAALRINNSIVRTPCVKAHMSTKYGMDIYFKCEFHQYTGSFKERGVVNALKLLSSTDKKNGIISYSSGNLAQAMSYHAEKMEIPLTVVVPTTTPLMKIQKCNEYNANVIIDGKDLREAKAVAKIISEEKSITFIDGHDHPHIIAGIGSIGLEIMKDVPEVDAILVPVGGGGLIAGVAKAVKHYNPLIKVYGVESEVCQTMSAALGMGRPTTITSLTSVADALNITTVGINAFATASTLIDKMIVVNEDWISRAILKLVETEKFVVEGSGAIVIGAVMSNAVPELRGKKVVCVLSGGNIDTVIFSRLIDRGLSNIGRLIKFKVRVNEQPGVIAELCNLIDSIGASVKDLHHETSWVSSDVFSVQMKVVVETLSIEHARELKCLLSKKYADIYFVSGILMNLVKNI